MPDVKWTSATSDPMVDASMDPQVWPQANEAAGAGSLSQKWSRAATCFRDYVASFAAAASWIYNFIYSFLHPQFHWCSNSGVICGIWRAGSPLQPGLVPIVATAMPEL